ncbi:DUF3574 domain-containing protein [Acetobacter estunensis]|uniref:DUF3574 domain-containing protein n=1 Tax=Acetobacter estunensis TaxID=104097 RepID=UPI001C2CE4AE|nr:DUF3574 domain-containing protein [Acetobacter estunensis]MBV1837630.1 DUF3574 domain-containing protein [Acetobacter estunensis]
MIARASLCRVALCLALMLVTGCASRPTLRTCSVLNAAPSLQVTLMFGMMRSDGSPVPESAWQAFLRTDITPRFPDGLTVLPAQGQWRERTTGAIQSEPSRLVWIVTSDTTNLPQRLEAIRAAWRSRFDQQSVGVSVAAACSAF